MTTVMSFWQGAASPRYANQWPALYGLLWPETRQHARHQPCPVCGGKDRFRLYPDWRETGGAICNQCGSGNGVTWIMRTLGSDFRDACRYIERQLGLVPADTHADGEARQRAALAAQAWEARRLEAVKACRPYRQRRLLALLAQGQPLDTSEPARCYLKGRGLEALLLRNDLPGAWLAVDRLRHRHQGPSSQWPALVAPARALDGEVVNVHRTYLDAHGRKAPVPEPRKLMPSIEPGAMKGAAIRLYPAGPTLALAEGIETALAVRAACRQLPVWACVSAYGLRHVALPAGVCRVFVMADKDLSGEGERAAQALAARLTREGREVIIRVPADPIPPGARGVDWLDVLNAGREVAA